MVGVNTHINYRGTVYDLAWSSIIRPRLIELGVRHIRDNIPWPSPDRVVNERYADLANAGIRLLLIIYESADKNYVKSLNALAGVQVVDAVEPPNERDLGGGSGWETRMRDCMTWLYPAYHDDPATRGITVLGPSFANTRDSPRALASVFPGASAYMDCGNLHNYSGVFPESAFGGGWGISQAASLETYGLISGTKPLWVTENGYKMSGSISGHPAVTQRAAAKYLPRQFLSHLKKGVLRYYIYQLINDIEDFGLINVNGSYRQQYISVKNFILMFSDRGPTFNTGTIKYSLSGDTSGVEQVLLQKRNGNFYLVLWQGVASVTGTSDNSLRDVEPAARSITLNLATTIRQARTYLPSFSMQQTASYNASRITSIPLSVPDHILVVELIP